MKASTMRPKFCGVAIGEGLDAVHAGYRLNKRRRVIGADDAPAGGQAPGFHHDGISQ